MDYADDDGESAGRLVESLVTRRAFSIVSIFAHSVEDSIRPALERAGFHGSGIMGALEKKVRGNMPLLVRPVAAETAESDWQVRGRDVRDPASWAIRGICSDAT